MDAERLERVRGYLHRAMVGMPTSSTKADILNALAELGEPVENGPDWMVGNVGGGPFICSSRPEGKADKAELVGNALADVLRALRRYVARFSPGTQDDEEAQIKFLSFLDSVGVKATEP